MAMASLYNWGAGGYFTNEWFLGTIKDNKFAVEDRGLLDYGQYCEPPPPPCCCSCCCPC